MQHNGKISGFSGDYRWLSNFWISPIEFVDLVFPSSEHAYQAAKSEDHADWIRFTHITTPGKAKAAGRLIRVREGWDDMKIDVMHEILQVKFYDPTLKQKLLTTGDAELIEENTWGDSFWGICGGKGHNHLGKLLMQVRAELKEQHQIPF